jgi:hypothetical protein
MNSEATKEILNELFSHLEKLETQTEAILQFLKEKKRVTDKQLAPYLERAGNASSVRWLAVRVRIEHLLLPEHPEKEIKLGKPPQMQEDPSRKDSTHADSSADSSKARRTEPDDEGLHGAKLQDTGEKDAGVQDTELQDKNKANDKDNAKVAPTDAVRARPADSKADKPEDKEEKSDAVLGNEEQAAQEKPAT